MNEYISYINKIKTFGLWNYLYEFGIDKELAIIKTEDEYKVFNTITGKEILKSRKIIDIEIYKSFILIEFGYTKFYNTPKILGRIFNNVIILNANGREAVGYARVLVVEMHRTIINDFTNFDTIKREKVDSQLNFEDIVKKLPKFRLINFLANFDNDIESIE